MKSDINVMRKFGKGLLGGWSLAAFLLLLIMLGAWGGSTSYAVTTVESDDGCAVLPNLGQCICHNFEHKGEDETCPSDNGIVSGHDCHLADYCCTIPDGEPIPESCNFPTLDCNEVNIGGVQDRFGKCNGCGNGITEQNEGCCDPDTDPDCTDSDNFCEECDDGDNVSGTNNCDENCQLEGCGDGNIDINEQCDGGALGSCDACNGDCLCCPDENDDGACDECENDSDCAGGNVCSTASCVSGECVNFPVDCSDGNPCTDDSCELNAGGCVHTDLDTPECVPGAGPPPTATGSIGGCSLSSDASSSGLGWIWGLIVLACVGLGGMLRPRPAQKAALLK